MRTGIDCFAGIGGFSLAMERCGIVPKVQIEIDEFCQRVLEKNFPKAKRFRDICTVTANDLRRHRPWVIAGGFPCQDISAAGKGVGANEGERSGLWREMWRLIRTTRPDWLLIENVPALRTRGSDSVLVALEALGYTSWPLVVGALHVGAPHQRQRVWIVAHAEGDIRRTSRHHRSEPLIGTSFDVANTDSQARGTCSAETRCCLVAAIKEFQELEGLRLLEHSNSDGVRKQSGRSCRQEGRETRVDSTTSLEHSAIARLEREKERLFTFPAPRGTYQYEWEEPRTIERGLGRAVDGLPGRLDKHRIKALGNAIVPQVAEVILRAMINVEMTTE